MSALKKQILISLGVALVLTAMLFAYLWYSQRGPKLGGDFTLVHRGQPWSFSNHAKDLNLLYVGYAKCPDVCPMALSFSAQALQQLSETERKNIQLVFISVDAVHDNAEAVATYAEQFNPSFIGLTGTQDHIDEAIMKFGASYLVEENKKSYLGYSIAHTDRIFVLDKKGFVINTIPSPRSADEILIKIKESL